MSEANGHSSIEILKGLKMVKMGEVCEIVSGNTPKGLEHISNKGNIQFYKVSDMNLEGNDVEMKTSKLSLTSEERKRLNVKTFPKGTVIFPKRGGAILTNKKRILSQESSFDLNLMGIIPNEKVDSKYLYYWFLKLDLSKIYDGSNVPQINNKNIAPLLFPLIPITAQRNNVYRLEELFSELDKSVEDLKTAQQQLKVYRQSVLKWAFESVKSPTSKTVEETSTHIVDCLHSTAKFKDNGKFCVDTTCIAEGKILFDKIRYVDEETFQQRVSRLKPQEGDILFAREGTVGTSVIVPKDIELCLGQRMMMFRLKEDILLKYFHYYLQSPLFKRQYKPYIGGTTSPHLNIRDIKKFKFISCPKDEQLYLVQEIEIRLSATDKVEETIVNSLEQAEALRQSILKKAFEGKLI